MKEVPIDISDGDYYFYVNSFLDVVMRKYTGDEMDCKLKEKYNFFKNKNSALEFIALTKIELRKFNQELK